MGSNFSWLKSSVTEGMTRVLAPSHTALHPFPPTPPTPHHHQQQQLFFMYLYQFYPVGKAVTWKRQLMCGTSWPSQCGATLHISCLSATNSPWVLMKRFTKRKRREERQRQREGEKEEVMGGKRWRDKYKLGQWLCGRGCEEWIA